MPLINIRYSGPDQESSFYFPLSWTLDLIIKITVSGSGYVGLVSYI